MCSADLDTHERSLMISALAVYDSRQVKLYKYITRFSPGIDQRVPQKRLFVLSTPGDFSSPLFVAL